MKKLTSILAILAISAGIHTATAADDQPISNEQPISAEDKPAEAKEKAKDAKNQGMEKADEAKKKQKDPMNKAGGKDATMSAQAFVNKAAASHQFEIESSELAVKKAKSDEVRAFAESMVDSHKELKNDLIELAKEDAVKAEVSSDLDKKHKKMLEELRGLEGEKFDKKYIDMQIKAHEKALEMFEKADEDGVAGEELQEYAGNCAEAVEEHLEQLKEILEDHEG